jgi:hypothetical protein
MHTDIQVSFKKTTNIKTVNSQIASFELIYSGNRQIVNDL